MASFLRELRRRNVFKVAVVYVIVAWLIMQVVDVMFPAFRLPEWTVTFVASLLVIGFPVALIFAWAFELTPQGLKKTSDVAPQESITGSTGRKLDLVIIAVLAAAVVLFALDRFVWVDESRVAATLDDGAPSVAVLPFANRSADEADAFFVDGIHDDLLSHVSKIGSIKTISRTSVLQYRDTTKTIPEIAAELGVTTVMEGGVQRAGDQVRINVQLIDARTDEHVWSEIYDRQLSATNIFAIQTEIATAIAEALRATLSTEEQDRLQSVPTENLAALEAYFLGKQRMATRATKELKEAAEYFSKAVTLDPDFALAYVGLADTYRLLNNYGGLPKDEMDAKGQAAVDRALQLDDQLGEAHASLANLRVRSGDVAGAEEAFQQALSLSPNYAPAYQWYGEFLGYSGRHEEGLPLSRRAVELDPLSAIINVDYAEVLETAGRFDEALAQYEKVLEFDPTFSVAATGIGDIYAFAQGRYDMAFPWYARSIALDPGRPWDPATLGLAYLDLGSPDAAEAWVRRALDLSAETAYPLYAAASLYLYRGEEQRALESALRVLKIYPDVWTSRAIVRNSYLEARRYDEALDLYRSDFPEVIDGSDPVVDGSNYGAAVDLALVLVAMNEPDRAGALLDQSLEQIQSLPRLGLSGYGIRDVQIHTIRGNTAEALGALREAVDAGWRMDWWYYLEHDLSLEPLRGEPEFQAIVDEIRTDMAAQLERIREMKLNGELPLPDSPGSSSAK